MKLSVECHEWQTHGTDSFAFTTTNAFIRDMKCTSNAIKSVLTEIVLLSQSSRITFVDKAGSTGTDWANIPTGIASDTVFKHGVKKCLSFFTAH